MARNHRKTAQHTTNGSPKPVRTPSFGYFRHTNPAAILQSVALSTLSTKYSPVMVTQRKSRRDAHIPIPGMIGQSCTHLNQPHDNPFDGPAHFFISMLLFGYLTNLLQVNRLKSHKQLSIGALQRQAVATDFELGCPFQGGQKALLLLHTLQACHVGRCHL